MKPGTIPPDPFGNTTDKVRMNPPRATPDLVKPAGPVDPGFTVVSIRSVEGKPIALLANYSLHYVGGIGGREVSADYFGEFARQIAARLRAEGAGSEFVGILSNGTSGDVNNIDFEHPATRMEPFEKIRQVAAHLADSALTAYGETKYLDWLPLGAEQKELPLRYRKPTAEMAERARRVLAQPDERNLPQHAKAYAERILHLLDMPEFADVKLGAMRLGDLGIAAIPCEVFTETGLEIKAKSPFQTVFTMELANGHYGYLPTPEQHELGGYETWMGTNLLEKEASRKITAAVLEMFGRLKAAGRKAD
jgi:neutral ceramidase